MTCNQFLLFHPRVATTKSCAKAFPTPENPLLSLSLSFSQLFFLIFFYFFFFFPGFSGAVFPKRLQAVIRGTLGQVSACSHLGRARRRDGLSAFEQVLNRLLATAGAASFPTSLQQTGEIILLQRLSTDGEIGVQRGVWPALGGSIYDSVSPRVT